MDDRGFESAVKEHRDSLHGYAFWMLRDRDDARDVAQEAMVRLWQHRGDVPGEAAKAWLLRTAHHLCVDRLRRRAVRSGPDMEEIAPTLRDPSPSPHRSASSREAGRRIADALASLSERDRAIVLLREVHGMAYEEIARTLDVNLGTLKATLHRARERLREHLVHAGVTP
jgi:RNA polymerase sigma-70 factor (ECF subfamily)